MPKSPPPSDGAPVDVTVGENIRLRRKTRGLAQAALAEACGVSFQQVQKYERGANRVSASMLVRIACALDCALIDLFQGVPGVVEASEDPEGFGRTGRAFLGAEGGQELARLFLIMQPAHRRALLAAARVFAQNP